MNGITDVTDDACGVYAAVCCSVSTLKVLRNAPPAQPLMCLQSVLGATPMGSVEITLLRQQTVMKKISGKCRRVCWQRALKAIKTSPHIPETREKRKLSDGKEATTGSHPEAWGCHQYCTVYLSTFPGHHFTLLGS